MTQQKKYFNLTELILLIVVGAVLLLIISVLWREARRDAWQSTCSFNMKSLRARVISYAHDHDRRLGYGQGDGLNVDLIWERAKNDFRKEADSLPDVLTCPAQKKDERRITADKQSEISAAENQEAYDFNGMYSAVGKRNKQVKIGNIAHPFLVTLWFDGTGTVMQSEKNLWTHFRFRHDDNRKVNNMFLDGHVETWTDTDAMNPDFEFYLLPKGDVPYLQAPYQSPHYPYHPFRQAE